MDRAPRPGQPAEGVPGLAGRLPGPAGGLDGRLALADQILELRLLGGEGVDLGGEGGDPLIEDGLGLLLVLLQQGHGLHRRLGVGRPLRRPVPGGGQRHLVLGQLVLRLDEPVVGVVVLLRDTLHDLRAAGGVGQVGRQRQQLAGQGQVVERAALAPHVGHDRPPVEDLPAVAQLHLEGGDVGRDLDHRGRRLVGVGLGVGGLGLPVGQVGGDLLDVLLELRLRRLGEVEVAADLLRPAPRLVALAPGVVTAAARGRSPSGGVAWHPARRGCRSGACRPHRPRRSTPVAASTQSAQCYTHVIQTGGNHQARSPGAR